MRRPLSVPPSGSGGGVTAGRPRVVRAVSGGSVLRTLRSALTALAGLAIFVGVWWLLSLGMEPIRLPPPSDVLTALWVDWTSIPALEFAGFQTGGIRDALAFTIVNVVMGVGIGVALGAPVGAAIGASQTARAVLGPPLVVAGTTPVLVLLPFLLIWFGTARLAQSGLVIFFAFVTVAAVTQQAVNNVGERYSQYATTLGASRGRMLRAVLLPAIVPEMLGAIRVSTAAGWSFATVSELLGGQQGIGKAIAAMAQLQHTADVLAIVLALTLVAVLFDRIIAMAGRWLVGWQE
jgi:ABC-type nitrate/sulfonate/bicarbonate transport system permease component